MDLLERYLQAVGEHLPAKDRADVLAELRANLTDQIEAREDDLHRPLTEDDVAAILLSHGHPLRRRPPATSRAARSSARGLPLLLVHHPQDVPLGAGGLGRLPARAAHIFGSTHPFEVGPVIVGLMTTLLYFFGWMTLAFVAIDVARTHYPGKVNPSSGWDPRKLPAIEPQEKQDLPKNPLLDPHHHRYRHGSLAGLPMA